MPLLAGKQNVSNNIRELLRSQNFGKGKDDELRKRMAVAAVYSNYQRKKKKDSE